jgi:hypothetical protein
MVACVSTPLPAGSSAGDSGPAIIPGDPDGSVLIQAIRYRDRLQMPPDGRLSDRVIADFERWVERGAYDPRQMEGEELQRRAASPWEDPEARSHWSYQPPDLTPLPEVEDVAWGTSDVDRYILARLEQAGLRPNPPASREVLIRRLTFDLTGLPPTPEAIEQFLADERPEAYEELVDRLLASPEFGEHWGRHWLDIARYGESVTLRGLIFSQAWRYRDYVIESFREDRPLDQMIREHVAGDLLEAPNADERKKQWTATTFLALGNSNLEDQDKRQLRMDVVDEQLEALGRAFLAQTLSCARCHDHKFDPLPTKDYYALAAILRNVQTLQDANVSQWVERPLPLSDEEEVEFARIEDERAELERQIAQWKAKVDPEGSQAAVAVKPEHLPGIVVDDQQAVRVGEWQESQFSGRFIGQGYLHDLNQNQGEKTLTFLPRLPATGRYEVRLAYVPSGNRASNTLVTVMSADGEVQKRVNQRVAPPIEGRFVSLGTYRFETDGQSFVIVSNEEANGHVIADAVQFLPVDGSSPKESPRVDSEELAEAAQTLRELEHALQRHRAAHPPRPQIMSVLERDEIEETAVHIRGSVHNLGDPVQRGFLHVAAVDPRPEFPDSESGRRQLADWLVDSDNPLTARVMANRIWLWLFGEGLVRTPDNFGIAGQTPTHPELLDYLAIRLREEGWSAKKMIRRLVLSQTYQLASTPSDQLLEADPDNQLWGRALRKRLRAESLRDAMLVVSDQLEPRGGGNTIRPRTNADYDYEHRETFRSVYAPVFRNSLPDIFELFDFADPSVVTGQRPQTIAPPQALFMMNHPFVHEQARRTAERLLEAISDDQERLDYLFRSTLGRTPSRTRKSALREVVPRGGGRAGVDRYRPFPAGLPRFPLSRLGELEEGGNRHASPMPLGGRSVLICQHDMLNTMGPDNGTRQNGPGTKEMDMNAKSLPLNLSRRDLLRSASCGFGYLALAGLASAHSGKSENPLSPQIPHFLPRAKRMIFLFMQGGPVMSTRSTTNRR